MRPRFAGWLCLAVALAVSPRPVSAQTDTASGWGRTLGGGGEIMVVAGPRDTTAFFNYSDYRRNMLRGDVSHYGIASATAENGRRSWALELGGE